jgi:L-amino acid N-acyltransferase YncA
VRPIVRSATAADAAACVAIYRPYVLNTVITFESEVPSVEEMAARIVAARVVHEWLVLEVNGVVAGYAYAQQFNPHAAYQWSVETTVYLAPDHLRMGGGGMLYAELLGRLAGRGYRRAFAGIAHPTRPVMGCTGRSGSGRWVAISGSAGSRERGTTSSGGNST